MSQDLLNKTPVSYKLVTKSKRCVGRSAQTGRISVRGRGGGVKKRYRIIDFRRGL